MHDEPDRPHPGPRPARNSRKSLPAAGARRSTLPTTLLPTSEWLGVGRPRGTAVVSEGGRPDGTGSSGGCEGGIKGGTGGRRTSDVTMKKSISELLLRAWTWSVSEGRSVLDAHGGVPDGTGAGQVEPEATDGRLGRLTVSSPQPSPGRHRPADRRKGARAAVRGPARP